jgi:hypothetical protein
MGNNMKQAIALHESFYFLPDEVFYIRTMNDTIDKFRKIIKTNKPFIPNDTMEYFLENPLFIILNLYNGKTFPRLSEKFWLFQKK